MKTYLMFAAVSIAALLTACSGSSPHAAILNAQQGFAQLSATKGVAAAFDHYAAKKAVFLPGGSQPVKGHDAIVNVLKQKNHLNIRWAASQAHVFENDTLGSVWGTYVAAAHDKTNAQVGYGKFLAVWQKQGQGWKIVTLMINQSPGPGALLGTGSR